MRLAGGNAGGATRVGNTVRRPIGAWTPAVHALLAHLHAVGFDRCPLPHGIDDQGREILSYLPGDTVGDATPWPHWVHTEAALLEAAVWLRDYHQAVADFAPPTGAQWRLADALSPGEIICHNDAAPYNAAWDDARLVGFFDWDFAGPGSKEWDLAFAAFAWVPLHARHVVEAEGFRDFDGRGRRLDAFLTAYGWAGEVDRFLDVVRARLVSHIDDLLRLASSGDRLFQSLVADGAVADISTAIDELPEALK
jgi:Phosphotransferase enzyme family